MNITTGRLWFYKNHTVEANIKRVYLAVSEKCYGVVIVPGEEEQSIRCFSNKKQCEEYIENICEVLKGSTDMLIFDKEIL